MREDVLYAGIDNRFLVRKTPLSGLLHIARQLREDARGSIERLYCHSLFEAIGIAPDVRQINRSVTRRRGTIRGLHFQYPPHAEAKFVQCLRGAVFDVAVDLRRSSPTFLQWHAEVLSEANGAGMFIPPGFAHGMQALEDDTELLYLHTADYAPGAEGGLNALDPALAINWPLEVANQSERDQHHSALTQDFTGLES